MPLAMKCQIKATQHKPVAVYNFAASLFCSAQSPHFRPWSTVAVPKVQLSHSRIAFFVVEIWSQRGRTLLETCHCNFNAGVHAIGKTTVAHKTNLPLPLHDGWFRTLKICDWPLNVKSTIRKANPAASRYLQNCSFTFLHSTVFRCRDLVPAWENRFGTASTTSTAASARLARLRLLPRQTEQPPHNGWHRTRKICEWP